MKWCRLYYEFAHDPKIQILPESIQRRFIMLMCLQTEGLLPGLTDQEVGHVLGISPAKLADTKKILLDRNLAKNDWTLENFEKRQFLSDDVTDRVRKYRASKINDNGKKETLPKRCSNVTVTASDTDTDTDTEIPPIVPQTGDTEKRKRKSKSDIGYDREKDFIKFWDSYNMGDRNPGSKEGAFKLWLKLSPEEKQLALERLKGYKNSNDWKENRMVQPVRYIRGKYWEGITKPVCSFCHGTGIDSYDIWSDEKQTFVKVEKPCPQCQK